MNGGMGLVLARLDHKMQMGFICQKKGDLSR